MNKFFHNCLVILVPAILMFFSTIVSADYVVEQSGYKIAVKVVPRIGAFDSDLYREVYNKSCEFLNSSDAGRMDWAGYKAELNGNKSALDYKLPNVALTAAIAGKYGVPDWDIVTTNLPGRDSDCNYGVRRVLVSVIAPGRNKPARCSLSFSGPRPPMEMVTDSGNCSIFIALSRNSHVPFRVQYFLTSRGAPVLLESAVPEDVLVVSLGDSYASGEGNPDAPSIVRPHDGGIDPGDARAREVKAATWMDPWCHRSVYAGPIRAAVKILSNEQEPNKSGRYQQAIAAGALTIISFACSGGTVSNSLIGSYAGVRARKNVMEERNKTSYTGIDALDTELLMPPQTQQLHSFLSSQRGTAEQKKASIDLLLLSGGGNDVLFAPLIKKMIFGNLADPEKRDILISALRYRFSGVEREYERLAESFRGNLFRFNGEEYEVRSIVPVLYPDFGYSAAGGNCVGVLDKDTPSIQAHVNRLILGAFNLRIENDEIDLLRNKVLIPLNGLIERVSKKYGWLAIDVGKNGNHDVKNHGWCMKGGKNYYAEQLRWFRGPTDSDIMQNKINGSFHPTWEFNEKMTGDIVAKLFFDAVAAEPDFEKIKISPSSKVGDVMVVPAMPKFIYSGDKPDSYCIVLHESGQAEPLARLGASDCVKEVTSGIGVHGRQLELVGQAKSTIFQRQYTKTRVAKLRVDLVPPELICSTSSSAGEPCVNVTGWHNKRQVTVLAVDKDAGVDSLSVRVTGSETGEWHVKATKVNDGAMQAVIDFPSYGSYVVAACSIDRVKNETGSDGSCEVRFTYNLDYQKPQPLAIIAYGVNWLRSPEDVPVIPVFGAGKGRLAVTVRFDSDRSGVVAKLDCLVFVEEGCLHQVEAAEVYWERKVIQRNFIDAAGNPSSVNYAVLRVPRYKPGNVPRSDDAWQDPLAADELILGLRAAFWIEPSLRELVSVDAISHIDTLLSDTSTPDARKSSAVALYAAMTNRDLVVAWLNTLHGYQYAEADVPLLSDGTCNRAEHADGQATMPGYLALRVQTKCALGLQAAILAGGATRGK